MNEVESNENESKMVKEKNTKDNNTFSILKYYFPEVKEDYTIDGVDYYIKDNKFSKSLFLTWFITLNLSLPLIVSIVNKPKSWNYTFGDWLLDFLGSALGFLIPSLIVAWIIAKNTRVERKLSKQEIDKYKRKYTSSRD